MKRIKFILYFLTFIYLTLSSFDLLKINALNNQISDIKVFEITNTCEAPNSVIAEEYLESIHVEKTFSRAVIDNLDMNKIGIQQVVLNIFCSPSSFIPEYSEKIAIIVNQANSPKLNLISEDVTVYTDNNFEPSTLISKTTTSTNELPVLIIDSDVNPNKNGDYSITYTIIDKLGNTEKQTASVHVTYSKEQLEEIRLEEEKKAEEARKKEAEKKKLEEEKKRLEEEEKRMEEMSNVDSTNYNSFSTPLSGSANNPYYGGWSNCTYGAWQLVHDNLGINLPGWGNAGTWLNSAQASGFSTSSAPSVNSIVVLSISIWAAWVSVTSFSNSFILLLTS